MRRAITALILLAALALPARAATEWVLILDNSGSMSTDQTMKVDGVDHPIPATDPDRLAVIATLIFRAFLSADDKLTILNFDSTDVGKFSPLKAEPKAIRDLFFGSGTFFTGPFKEAARILNQSTMQRKILLLVTDGAPSPEGPPNVPGHVIDAPEARQLLTLDPGPAKFEVMTLALGTDPITARLQSEFLKPLGHLDQISTPTDLVSHLTSVFAESIRSRPETGRLEPGASYQFPVGKYVTEILISVATERTTGEFETELTAGGSVVKPIESGDSGCMKLPCHAYQVYRLPHDPKDADQLTLKLTKSKGPVAYGIILRYDLQGEIISAPASAKVGEDIDVVARMTWQGQTFNDPAFFAADGFKSTLSLGGAPVPLTRRDDGTFTAKINVTAPGLQALKAEFSNQWITVLGERPLKVEEWMPLELHAQPNPADFGTWTGGRTATERCLDLDLAGSTNADKVPLEALAESLPKDMLLLAPTPLVVKAGKTHLCLRAPGCCSNLDPGAATLVVRGQNPHYHPGAARLPMKFTVHKTPFLVCWWRVLAAIAGAILLIIIIVGFVRPHDFPKEEVVRLAKTEAALARAPARRLRELPGGRRGFYRDAQAAFDGTGNAIRSGSGASLVLRAKQGDPVVTSRGGLEEKDPRTRKFQPVKLEGATYLRRGVIYRVGEFFFRMG